MDFIGQEPTIIEEIAHLISLKQEGRFWDFKKQWYELQTACRVDTVSYTHLTLPTIA